MDFKKLIMAAIVGFLVLFSLDYLWFGVIFKNYWAAHMHMNGMDSIPMHALGDFSLALLMAITYPMGYKGGSATMEGFKFGMLMGLMASLPSSLHVHAGGLWSLHIVAVLVLNGIIVVGITGIIIAMIYGGKKASV